MLFIIVLSALSMGIEAGVQVPHHCVIDLPNFKANVTGKDWITLYSFNDDQSSHETSLKQHTNYSMLQNDTLIFDLYRWNEVELFCQYNLINAPITTYGINEKKAEFQGIGERVVRYVSSSPAEYLITNVCVDGPTCSKSVNAVKVVDQRTDASCLSTGSSDIVLDNIPWDEINDDLKNCYGREFKDNLSPPVEWVWKSRTECPPPSAS